MRNQQNAKKSHFYKENQNSDTTFFSPTLKVEENKVVSEYPFSLYKYDFWPLLIFYKIKYGHMSLYGHKLYDHQYGLYGYLWKEHNKTNSPVKKSSDLDVWLTSYGQNKDFNFSTKNFHFVKYQKWSKNHIYVRKMDILTPLYFYLWKSWNPCFGHNFLSRHPNDLISSLVS